MGDIEEVIEMNTEFEESGILKKGSKSQSQGCYQHRLSVQCTKFGAFSESDLCCTDF